MSFLNTMMNRVAMNNLKHEHELAGLVATCQISNGELSGAFADEEAASHGFYASFQMSM